MRPISLTMESFGSYSKKTEIYFDDVKEPIFLITGDTGAGKSTIFDAMVFALYGKSSSANGKDGLDFKSQYGDKKPEVTFKFKKNNKEYTIKRSLKEVKKIKNGIKTVGKSATLSLTLPDNTEFLGKVPETEKKIEEIIGLTKEQFMQIAMIAQGEFMALLRAKSDNKKEIFRKLFHTEKFAKIIEIIKEKRRNVKNEAERAEDLCKKDVGRIRISNNEELSKLQEEIISDKNINIVALENFLALAEENLKANETEKASLDGEVAALKKDRDVIRENIAKGEELKKDFDLLNSEDLRLKELLKKEEEIKGLRKISAETEKSYELKDKFENYENSLKKFNLLNENLTKEEKNAPLLKKEFSDKENELKIAEKDSKEKQAQISETIEKAKAALKIFDETENIKKELGILEKELKNQEIKKENIKVETEKLKAETETNKQKSESLKGIDGRREILKREAEELEKFTDAAKELKKYEETIKSARDKTIKLQEEYNNKKSELEKIESEYKSKENRFFDSQAGVLAKTLKENEPCPVCGSLHHPSPAKFTDEEIKKEELDLLSEKLKILRENRELFAKAISENNAVLVEKEKLYNGQKEEIKSAILSRNIKFDEEITLAGLRKIYADLKAELAKKQDLLQKEEQEEKSAADFMKSAEKRQAELEKLSEDLNKIHIELAKKISVLRGKNETLEKNKVFPSKKDAAAALSEAQKQQAELEKFLKNLRTQKDSLKSKLDKCETLIAEFKANLPKAEDEAKLLEQNYKLLKEKYDLSEEEWRNCVDKHKKEETKEFEGKIKEFESEKSKLEGSVNLLKSKTTNKNCPNLDEIKKALSEKEKILFGKEEKLNLIRENFSNNQDALKSLKKEKTSREKILSLHQTYDKLANKLSSNASGGYLDIETFVQRYYLSEILSFANIRLYDLTNGEYELRLAGDKEANEFKNRGGLDFMIHSFVTGKDREIRTLSGGESFLTALALSLGMADSIERRSVAVSPDILFIDEGFGSLDNNARREAVRVLKAVAGTNRMIAVISHVMELRREMETKLVVKKDAEGSSVRWES